MNKKNGKQQTQDARMIEWVNTRVPQVADKLERNVLSSFYSQEEEGLDLSGRTAIYEVLNDILAVLFPGFYSKDKVEKKEMNFFIGDRLRHISLRLGKIITEILKYHCKKKDDCDDCTCEEQAQKALTTLVESLPEIRKMLLEDIEAAYEGDPAASCLEEIILSYPCIEAIATYRIAHLLYKLDVPLVPRIMTEHAHSRTGIDIHPGAKIGPRFFIDHGTGVVIGETTTIGKNVRLYQGVTLGALSPFDKKGHPQRGVKRHPDIQDEVIIYANATILGGKTVIGKGAVVGGNSWITKSVPAGAVVYKDQE
ncbi:MAG TPA: serine O-acetyltransferase EpsC [Chitinivibrionales bacterium]|nr:serine O-acetyltransferase EpsC [Chitinivibrionales bacterium]